MARNCQPSTSGTTKVAATTFSTTPVKSSNSSSSTPTPTKTPVKTTVYRNHFSADTRPLFKRSKAGPANQEVPCVVPGRNWKANLEREEAEKRKREEKEERKKEQERKKERKEEKKKAKERKRERENEEEEPTGNNENRDLNGLDPEVRKMREIQREKLEKLLTER